MTDTEAVKLTNENWNEITQTKYNLDFLNARNAVRAVLYELLQIDNEIKCTNVKIQNLKKSFDSQLCFLQDEVQRAETNELLDIDEKNSLIADLVNRIEETNAKFSAEVKQFHLTKGAKCQLVSENVDKLFQLKSQFKFTHQTQVENLKRFLMFCERATRSVVETRLKSVDRKFCDELFYMQSCEANLKHLFSLIDDGSSREEVCGSASSTVTASEGCSEFFRDFAWMRNEQRTKRTELFEYFMKYLAKDCVAALTAMHVLRPSDPIKFIANYLKHLKQNEFRIIREERIFSASKHGENLFPNNK